MKIKNNWYSISNKSNDITDVYIMDVIGKDFWGEGISGKTFIKDLKAITTDTINFWVNCPGGNVFDANAIYNAIKMHPAKNKIMHITGVAASAASFIIMACDERIIYDGGMIMVHLPSCLSVGNKNDHLKTINALDIVETEMINIYQKQLDLSEDEIKDLLNNETWLDSQEAVDKGFCTKKDETKATAQIELSDVEKLHYKNVPKNIIKLENPTKDMISNLMINSGYSKEQITNFFNNQNNEQVMDDLSNEEISQIENKLKTII